MKLMKNKKVKSDLYGGGKSFAAPPKKVVSWAITDPKQIRQRAQEESSHSNRAPEFWVNAGERRRIRFLDKDAAVVFNAYRAKIGGKWSRIVAPGDGEPDLIATNTDLRASAQFLFRIIDIDGYENQRTKKRVKNLPRFYLIGNRVYEQLMLLAETTGIPLNKMDVIVVRSGSGQNTVYQFIPRPGEPDQAVRRAMQAKFPNWEDFYHPPTKDEQRRILRQLGAADIDDASEDGDDED